ncbi:MAG: phosphoglycerate kinase, partial [Bacilli bacterium]|nr:phosphoglycerate kinase [Bacilli bacterium]
NIVSDSLESNTCTIKDNSDIKDNDMGLDIGPKTIELFKTYINKSNTIIWNGPLGVFENEMYANGTNEILKSLIGKTTIIAGGDTASAAINAGYKDIFTHISTGGGASLEMMEGATLPAIDIIKKK